MYTSMTFDVCDDKIRRAPGLWSSEPEWVIPLLSSRLDGQKANHGTEDGLYRVGRETETIYRNDLDWHTWRNRRMRLLLLVKLYLRMAMRPPCFTRNCKDTSHDYLEMDLSNVGCLKKEISIPQTLWPNMTYSESNLVGRLYFHARLHQLSCQLTKFAVITTAQSYSTQAQSLTNLCQQLEGKAYHIMSVNMPRRALIRDEFHQEKN